MEHPVGFIPLLVYKLFRLVVMSRDSFTLANFSELDNLIIVNTSVQDLNVLRRNTMWSARNSNSMLNLKFEGLLDLATLQNRTQSRLGISKFNSIILQQL